MPPSCGSTWCWPTRAPSATPRPGPDSPLARVRWVPSSSWRRSPSTTGHRATTPVDWPAPFARCCRPVPVSRRTTPDRPTTSRPTPRPAVRKDIGHGSNTGADMAMTAAVKDELSRLVVTKPCDRKAEMAALLRFAGGLHLVAGRVVVEAELDTGVVARRLRKDIAEVFGYASDIHVVAAGGLRKGSRYVLRVTRDGEALARQTGLLDSRGRPVRGLPPQVVAGSTCDA